MTAGEFTEAVGRFATGVTVVTVRDGRDDVGGTVSAFCSVSLEPPLVLVSLAAQGYLAEAVLRAGTFGLTVLAEAQKQIAGRFAAEGRPSARLLLGGVAHRRGEHTEALIVEGGTAALECAVRDRVAAGDHTLVIAEVLAVPYVTDAEPLVHLRGRYRAKTR
ncbi:MAG: flavin reductase [Streptosporangiales bacterium]|nr:flavin reductase [Streptosporangiales bacterium]